MEAAKLENDAGAKKFTVAEVLSAVPVVHVAPVVNAAEAITKRAEFISRKVLDPGYQHIGEMIGPTGMIVAIQRLQAGIDEIL